MTRLYDIRHSVHDRVDAILASEQNWPCRKGCDDCCRHLASAPVVTREEWECIADALRALPAAIAESARSRIRESAGASRPVTCPLLDDGTGVCLVYEARPVACRAYGFYAERETVLGCHRIESIACQSPDVIWGNHESLEERLSRLGPGAELYRWLDPL